MHDKNLKTQILTPKIHHVLVTSKSQVTKCSSTRDVEVKTYLAWQISVIKYRNFDGQTIMTLG